MHGTAIAHMLAAYPAVAVQIPVVANMLVLTAMVMILVHCRMELEAVGTTANRITASADEGYREEHQSRYSYEHNYPFFITLSPILCVIIQTTFYSYYKRRPQHKRLSNRLVDSRQNGVCPWMSCL